MKPVNDHIRSDLKILFVGYNPSIQSSETGHHFANPNNRFWTILYQSGLTPRKYTPFEDALLLELGYGLTNIVPRPTKAADEITNEEYSMGRTVLIEKVKMFQPNIICFVGKGVYLKYSGKKSANWGIQEKPLVSGTIDFVAPSSSGLVRMPVNEIVDIYHELSDLIEVGVNERSKSYK